MKTELSIIIVNWNAKESLRSCLISIYAKVKDLGFETIVVDNASKDASVDMVSTEFPMVRLLVNQDNKGFGRACNQAAKESMGEYLLFLNPDTEVLEANINKLIKFMEENKDIGIIVPLVFEKDGLLKYKFIRNPPKIRELLDHHFGKYVHRHVINIYRFFKSNLWSSKSSPSLSTHEIQEQGYASGSCLLISKIIFKEANGFDERFFLYWEDVDLSVRIKAKERRIISYPSFKIFHKAGESTKQAYLSRELSAQKSTLIYFRKHHHRMKFITVKIILLIATLADSLHAIIIYFMKPSSHENKQLVKYQWKILRWHIVEQK